MARGVSRWLLYSDRTGKGIVFVVMDLKEFKG